MKKFLSLVLALIMVMSLVTVSAGADFTDASKITYDEAVEVMTALKVVDGDTDGSFRPTDTLTRGAAAKIICNLILGPTTAAALKADTAPYPDVAANSTFAGYIAYCKQQGIISGYADGTFKPANTLTGYAFMKMLLGALGYDAEIEGYNVPNWSIAVAKRALNIGLDDGLVGVLDGTAAVTREEALLFAFNAMKADMVDYDATTSISVGGANVVIAGSKAETIENKAKTEGIAEDDVLQFAEKYFPKLKGTYEEDAFDRPATTWKNGTKKIGNYVNAADLEYTAAVELGDIYADLGLSASETTDDFSIDGKDQTDITLSKGSETEIGANGVLTQVWWDEDTDNLIITEIETYVAKVATVVKATTTEDRYITLAAYAGNKPANLNAKFETEEFAAKDLVTYTVAYSEKDGRYEIQAVEALEGAATGVLTEWNGKSYATVGSDGKDTGKSESNFTVGGETYKYSANVIVVDEDGAEYPLWKFDVDEAELNVYVDEYGYAIYVDGVEAEKNYAALIGYGNTNQYGSVTRGATLLFADGTKKEVTAKLANSGVWGTNCTANNLVSEKIGDLVTYTVDDDGVYTLTVVGSWDETNYATANDIQFVNGKSLFKLDSSDNTKDATLYATSETVFFVVTKDSKNNMVYNVYTGYAEMPSIDAAETGMGIAYVKDSSYTSQLNFVYLYADKLAGLAGVDTYFVKPANATIITNSKGSYYVLNAIEKGVETTVMVDATCPEVDNNGKADAMGAEFGLFAITNVIKDKNGIITSFDDVTTTAGTFGASNNNYVTGTVAANEVVLGIGGSKTSATYWAYNDETAVYVVDKDYKTITVSSVASVATDSTDLVYADADTDTKVLTDVIIVEQPETVLSNVAKIEGFTVKGVEAVASTATGVDFEVLLPYAVAKDASSDAEAEMVVDYTANALAVKFGSALNAMTTTYPASAMAMKRDISSWDPMYFTFTATSQDEANTVTKVLKVSVEDAPELTTTANALEIVDATLEADGTLKYDDSVAAVEVGELKAALSVEDDFIFVVLKDSALGGSLIDCADDDALSVVKEVIVINVTTGTEFVYTVSEDASIIV